MFSLIQWFTAPMASSEKLQALLPSFASYAPILTTSEVANLLSMSVQEVRRLTREGILPARRVGKAYRYFRDEVVGWLDAQSPG